MVIKEWKCEEHGYFESKTAQCPQGCTNGISQVFLTPVAMKSDKTKHSDKTLKQLAMDFNMTDIKSAREGEAQPPRFAQPKPQPENPFAVRWGSPGSIGNYNVRSVAGENVNGLAAVKQSGVQLTRPKTASYIADHQNLKLDK